MLGNVKAVADVVPLIVTVVNTPVLGVVAPTVPLMLIDAVPVKLVTVPLEGVPNAPPLTTKAPAEPVFTPRAVTTPVPVVTVLGVAPAPPPTIKALAVKTALVAHVDVLEKYGMPPLVPATVSANVPDVVIGEPATETMPPVNDCATEVTVPDAPALDANKVTVPALFFAYSFMSEMFIPNSPLARLPAVGIAAAVVLKYN
jgi:hypothetical protein